MPLNKEKKEWKKPNTSSTTQKTNMYRVCVYHLFENSKKHDHYFLTIAGIPLTLSLSLSLSFPIICSYHPPLLAGPLAGI